MAQDRLEQAIINVLETQAIMQNSIATMENSMAKLAERQVDSDERWFKIREELNHVINILNEHTALLQGLPEAIREKIGFKA